MFHATTTPPLPPCAPPPVAPATGCASKPNKRPPFGSAEYKKAVSELPYSAGGWLPGELEEFVYGKPATKPVCADCGCEIGHDKGPRDGWQLGDGRTVCQACCVAQLNRLQELMRLYAKLEVLKIP